MREKYITMFYGYGFGVAAGITLTVAYPNVDHSIPAGLSAVIGIAMLILVKTDLVESSEGNPGL